MSFTEFLSSDLGCKECPKIKPEFRPWPKIAIDCIRDVNYIANPEVTIHINFLISQRTIISFNG